MVLAGQLLRAQLVCGHDLACTLPGSQVATAAGEQGRKTFYMLAAEKYTNVLQVALP